MVIIEICGGIGNQMFRYAFAKSYAEEKGEKLYLSLRTYKKNNFRAFALDKLSIKGYKEINYVFLTAYLLINKIVSKTIYRTKSSIELFNSLGLYNSEGIEFITLASCEKKVKYFSADFQSEKYFKGFSKLIREEFMVSLKASPDNEVWIKEIDSCKTSVCVHIRRGDYVRNDLKNYYLVCTEQYYHDAIMLMKSKLKNPIFYFFSEDINWVKSLALDCNAKYVDLNNPDYEELRLMYSCKHFIISNSTFSWWAQYLSDYDKKIVIAPKKWFNTESNQFSAIYLDNWILLDTQDEDV